MELRNDYLQQSIKGKKILITGGTTGIGRTTAVLLSELGADIMIVGMDKQHLAEALKQIRENAKGSVHGIIADLGYEAEIQRVFDEFDKNFRTLDILINNAALAYGSITEGGYKDWQQIISTNLLAYMACCSGAIKRMTNGGHIVNVGSMSADVREETGSVYVATKSGIQGFSEALRKQANKDRIKITLIEPGAVDTNMQEESSSKKQKKVQQLKMLTTKDIAAGVVFCLAQPLRCDIVELKIKPHLQLI